MLINEKHKHIYGLDDIDYLPHPLFKNSHFSTIYPYAFRKSLAVEFIRERWLTADGDFLDIDVRKKGSDSCILLLHGLEGSSSSQYIKGLSAHLNDKNLDIYALNHRGCSGVINNTLTLYHSGFTQDLEFILEQLSHSYNTMFVVGFSLGGNMILKYLGTCKVPSQLKKVCAISVPCHLSSSAVKLNHWSNRPYAIQFLKSLNNKIMAKARQFPEKLDENDYKNITSLYEFDNKVTAPLHGFTDAEDYYEKSSSLQFLHTIGIPSLMINAMNDSFLSPQCFPYDVAEGHEFFHMLAPKYGGHVGFGKFTSGSYWIDRVIGNWLLSE